MMNKLFSHGKLLISSEYVILDGAIALAIPTKLGQELLFEEKQDNQPIIYWESLCQGNLWLKTKINYHNWQIIETNNNEASIFIRNVLKQIQELSPLKFNGNISYIFKSNLEFPQNFGLGSSSTLLNNLAQWANIDAYLLNQRVLGGSGYDIAVAKEAQPILYQTKQGKKIITPIYFSPKFKDELIFIHLNQKQNSREGISLYQSKTKSEMLISEFSTLTKKIISCEDIEQFSEIINLHEDLLSKFLGLTKVKDLYFSNCPVFIKSLGAWGGDFILTRKFENYHNYFIQKGFKNIFTWEELILHP